MNADHHTKFAETLAKSALQSDRTPTVPAVEQIWNNRSIIERLIRDLAQGQTDGLDALYADDARLVHPILGTLGRAQIEALWLGFIEKTTDLQIYHDCQTIEAEFAGFDWSASFYFQPTGRFVRIDGKTVMSFHEGRIKRQTDFLNMRNFSRQLLGWRGLILSFVPGWRRFLEVEIRQELDVSYA
jgi:hypothetical protein